MPRTAGRRSVVHVARDLRGVVSLTRDHARLLLDEGERVCLEHRRSLEVIQRQVLRLDRLIDEMGLRWPDDAGPAVAETPPVEAGRHLPRVLIADDDPDLLAALADVLGNRYELKKAHDGREALAMLRAEPFDLAILDQHMPEQDGLEIARVLALESREQPAFLFLSGDRRPDVRTLGLSMGDFITKPVASDELLARIARILASQQRERSLLAEAMSDPLTGLANYRSLARNLELELDRAQRYDLPLSLLTIDLDGLKHINDELGHGAGNDAIRTVAAVLEGAVRKFETVARQGGDELSILLPNATRAEALQLGERLRAEVARRSVRGLSLSISVGVASREPGDQGTTVQSLVEASDDALYRAKRAGRNRVSAIAR